MDYQCVGPFHKRLLQRVSALNCEKLRNAHSRAPFDSTSFPALVCACVDIVCDLLTWWMDPLRNAREKFHRMAKSCDDLVLALARAFRLISLKETAAVGFSRPFHPLSRKTNLGDRLSSIASDCASFIDDRLRALSSSFPLNPGFFLPSERNTRGSGLQRPDDSIAEFISCCSEFITRTAFVLHPVVSPKFDPGRFSKEILVPVADFMEQKCCELEKVVEDDVEEFLNCDSMVVDGDSVFVEALGKVRVCLRELCKENLEPSEADLLLTKSRNCLQEIGSDLNSFHTRNWTSNQLDHEAKNFASRITNVSPRVSKLARGEDEEYECYVRSECTIGSRIREGGVFEDDLSIVGEVKEILNELQPVLVLKAEDWAKREKAAVERNVASGTCVSVELK